MALNAALTLAPLAIGAFHKKKKGPNINSIIARYRAERPTGYTTAEDLGAAERTRTRIAGAATAAAQRARQMNQRQVTARGLAGPAAAALEQGATDVEAAGAEEAARNSADQLYQAFQSNLGYERQKSDTAFGAEIGAATQERAQRQAQEGTFWNSMFEAIPAVMSGFSAGTPSVKQQIKTAHAGVTGPGLKPAVAPVTPAQSSVRRQRAYR